jgi:hypothetical protein
MSRGEGSNHFHLARLGKIFEKLFKNLLTNRTECDIIYVLKGKAHNKNK